MEAINSKNKSEGLSLQKSAKTAGIAYLAIIVTSILSMIFGPFKLMVEGDNKATVQNIADNQFLFRIGATYDLLMFIGVIILSVALFNVLKTVNKSFALTALISRIGEALIGSLTVVCSVIILYLINRENPVESNHNAIALIFEIKHALLNIVFCFLGLGSIIFCYLFYKSRMIPRILAAFGILAFTLVFSESILVFLFPIKSSIITGVSAILFELIIGFWLMLKGVKTDSVGIK